LVDQAHETHTEFCVRVVWKRLLRVSANVSLYTRPVFLFKSTQDSPEGCTGLRLNIWSGEEPPALGPLILPHTQLVEVCGRPAGHTVEHVGDVLTVGRDLA
jgi:hypothetical protein